MLRTDDPTLEGNRFINVPLHTAALQSRYYLNAVTGLSLGGTVAYVDERPANADNTVTDEEIFSPGSFDGVIREEGRTYLARVKYLF